MRYWINFASSFIALNQLDTARDYAERAAELGKKLSNLEGTSLAWMNLGFIEGHRGNWTESDDFFDQAFKGIIRLNSKRQHVAMEEKRIKLYLEKEEIGKAKTSLDNLVDLCNENRSEANLAILDQAIKNYNSYEIK